MHSLHDLLSFLKNKEMNELYSTMAIRAFAVSLIGVFIPIYLYQVGYPISKILFLFGLESFFSLLLLFPGAKLSSRLGTKHTILLSTPFLIIFLLLLFSIQIFNWPLWILALFLALHVTLFWPSYHTEFSRFSRKKIRARQVGFSRIVILFFGILGPIFGGVVLYLFGFKILFVLVSFLLLASTFPLFLSKEIHEPAKFSLEGFFRKLKLKNVFAYMGTGIETRLEGIIWPLFAFIFILGEKYTFLGFTTSLYLASAVIFTFIVGKFSDLHRKLTLKIGIFFNSVVWIAKSFIITPFQVFVADAFYGISQTTLQVPFEAINYDKAEKSERSKIILEREFCIKFGASIFLFTASFFTDYFLEMIRYIGPISSFMRFFF